MAQFIFIFSSMAMTHGTSIEDVMSDISTFSWETFGGMYIIFQIALYIFYSYCQYTLSKKLEVQYSWMAWIPVLSIFNLVKIAWKSYWWVIWIFLGFIVFIIPGIILTIIMTHGISKRTGHGGWWTVWLVFLGFIFLPITALQYQPSATGATPTV